MEFEYSELLKELTELEPGSIVTQNLTAKIDAIKHLPTGDTIRIFKFAAWGNDDHYLVNHDIADKTNETYNAY